MIRPICVFLYLAPLFILFNWISVRSGSRREALLSALLFWAGLVTLVTEILSFFSILNFLSVLLSWVAISATLGIGLARRSAHEKRPHLIFPDCNFTRFSILLLLFLIGLSFFVAVMAPPNNYDSMTYHMPRVVHWIQRQSVAHYPTETLRQLDSPPWASFAVLNLQLLSGGDRWANLVQLSAMLASAIGVSLIAQTLGAGLKGQVLSLISCVSIPMGVLQSVTTQNDYVVSLWLVCLAYNCLRLFKKQFSFNVLLDFGLSLGLALLTKGTAYIYALPFVFTAFYLCLRNSKRTFISFTVLVLSITLLINIGHWTRNYHLFRDPLGKSNLNTKNSTINSVSTISNIVRHAAVHFATPVKPVNEWVESRVRAIHDLIGADVNDERTTFPDQKFNLVSDLRVFIHEDYSGNLISFLMLIGSMVAWLIGYNRRFKKQTLLLFYGIALMSMWVLFSASIRWQPWVSRLHLPMFVLGTAFTGRVWGEYLESSKKLSFVLVFGLIGTSLPYILFCFGRPLLNLRSFEYPIRSIIGQPRVEGYFNITPQLRAPYLNAINLANKSNCNDIGFFSEYGDLSEYPFFAAFKLNYPSVSARFKTLGVKNQSVANITIADDFTPCMVFALGFDKLDDDITFSDPRLGVLHYKKISMDPNVAVYGMIKQENLNR
jgi:4-amino-4-deoxy-L-arabinose transferase-like glycosyltransferase